MLDSGLYRGAVKGYRDAAEIEGKAFSLPARLTRRDTGHSCSISLGAGLGGSVAAVALGQVMLFAGRPTKMARHAVVNGPRYPSV
jgi:hypothetical protein